MKLFERLYKARLVKKHVGKVAFDLKRRPSVSPDGNGLLLRNPVVIISADLELAWGWRFSKRREDPNAMTVKARENIPRLLKMFEEYDIPVTWAIVGHLLLHSCGRDSHAWMHRIPYFQNRNWVYSSGDWFDDDPRANWKDEPSWYAPDLVKMILESRIAHEIGCHTFSHIDFSNTNCPPAVAEDEVDACVDAARKWGIELRSFVFPGGTYGNIDVLQKKGFMSYRMTLEHELSLPFFDSNGLVVLPASVELGDCQLGWSAYYYVERYSKYLAKAVQHNRLCHFWFHPSRDTRFAGSVIPALLASIANLRNEGMISVGTMASTADLLSRKSRKDG
jgi:peptidoglycan/xylan/chitin deacetylase (PgdA/CDA1 family)